MAHGKQDPGGSGQKRGCGKRAWAVGASLALLALAAPVQPASAQSANLLQDGGFEVDPTEAKNLIHRQPPANIGVWELDYVDCRLGCGPGQRYSISEGTASRPVPEGKFALNIGNSFDPGVARQAFPTTVGTTYTVSLYAVNGAGIDAGQGSVRIFNGNGNDLQATFTNGYAAWKRFSYTFTATAGESAIEIRNLGNGGKSSRSAMIIDDVRVEAVAERTKVGATPPTTQERKVSALSGDDCALVLPATTCTARVHATNPGGQRLCLWQLEPFRVLTCHGAVATFEHDIAGLDQTARTIVLTAHGNVWPSHDQNGFASGTEIGRLALKAVSSAGEILLGDNCEPAPGQTTCGTTLYITNRTGKNTCLWQLQPFKVQSCVGGTVERWNHPVGGLDATGRTYALTTHIGWPQNNHNMADYRAGTLIATVEVKAVAAGTTPQPNTYASNYLFMDRLDSCHTNQPQNCYLTNEAAARSAITEFTKLGVQYYLLPSADLAEIELFGDILAERNFSYYTQEIWEIAAASKSGSFVCDTYMNAKDAGPGQLSRREEFLRLLDRHGSAFAGIALPDEPSLYLFADLEKVRQCIENDPDLRISSLDVFLNLFPLYMNEQGIRDKRVKDVFIGGLNLASMGYAPCTSNAQFNPAHRTLYTDTYVRAGTLRIRPSKLAFDMYLQDPNFIPCAKALTDMMHINMVAIQQTAASVSAEPISVNQNFINNADEDGLAPDSSQLEWFSAWSIAHGIKRFVYFLSHDKRPQTNSDEDFDGLLFGNNQARSTVFTPTLNAHLALNTVLQKLKDSTYQGLTASFLNRPKAGFVHWLPAHDVLTGSYQDADPAIRYVVIVRRDRTGQPSGTASFDKWYTKVDLYNPATKGWDAQAGGQATNHINYALGTANMALVRLTR